MITKKKIKMGILVLLLGAIIVTGLTGGYSYLGCVNTSSNNSGSSNIIGNFTETGTVRYISLEGGFYGIIGDSGNSYDPTNLADDFKQDGLRIRFKATRSAHQAGIHMWGIIIDIVEISRI